MKTKYMLFVCVLALMATQVSFAGSLKGKVAPGKSVVYLEAAAPAPAATDKPVTMDQKGLSFQPHVMVIQLGTTVEFLNSDKVQHNVFWPSISGDKKKTHNMGTWPQGQKKAFKFTDPGVVTLLCNVHPEMSGYVVVVPTPYFAVTDKDGNFEIKNVPAGKYTLKTWSEDGKPTTQAVDLSGASATVDLTVKK